MNADFTTVWEFFERTGPEVSGHAMLAQDWPDAPLVQRFISAELTAHEKHELCEFLKTHPHYIQYLVGRLRHAGQLTPTGHPPAELVTTNDAPQSPPAF